MELPLYNSNRTMQLLNKTAVAGIPKIGEQDGKDAIAYLKFFINNWTWFLTELDLETGEAFGKVYSPMEPDGELGYFSMIELSELRGRIGHGVERDRYWDKKPLSQVKNPCG